MNYSNKNNIYTENLICPITKSNNKVKYFDLGNTPLVNNLYNSFEESINCEKYPLSVSLFKESGLTVLDITVNPDKLFSNYLYRSSTNIPYITHAKEMFRNLVSVISLSENDICVDIGGNDGTLLIAFNEASKELNLPLCKKINIDPSDISNESNKRGIRTINEFFTEKTFNTIGQKAKLIITTNVFQHLSDIKQFLNGINLLLDDNGIWCLEFPYWGTTMETNQFDQIYHEHIYYYLISPLKNFLENNDLRIVNASEHFIHGGSVRLLITKTDSSVKSDDSVSYFISKEKKYDSKYYLNWSNQINSHLKECENILKNIEGNIVGFGAAAKGCIFLNRLNIDYNTIKYVIDDTLEKQGKYIPGTGIKVINRDIINNQKIDYILILAHNFSKYIMDSLISFGYKGKFLILLPEIKII